MNLRRLFLIGLIASLSLGAANGIYILLFSTMNAFSGKVIFTTLLLGIFSILGLGNSFRIRQHNLITLGHLGIILSAISLFLFLIGIWSDIKTESFWQWTIISTDFTIMVTHINLILLVPVTSSRLKIVRSATIVFTILLAIMLAPFILEASFTKPELYARYVGVCSILVVLGTVVTPLLSLLDNHSKFKAP